MTWLAVVLLIQSVLPTVGYAQEVDVAADAAPLVFRHTRIETQPAEAPPSLAPLAPESRAHDGLQEQRGGTAAGGVIVDLGGRLGSLMVLEQAADGALHPTCIEQPRLGLEP